MDEMLILVCENEKGMSFSLLGGQTFGILHYIAFLKVFMQQSESWELFNFKRANW